MDKNIIKQYLDKTFLSEASDNRSAPGIKLAGKMASQNKKINKSGVDAVGKDMKDIESSSKKMDANEKTMATNKFNYEGKSEEDYHKEMEIMNGQEMIQYDRTPGKSFKDRAIEAIEGSTRMGNNPEWANVVAKGQGGDPEFGKNLVKSIKASEKKRAEQTPTSKMFGNDWEVVADKGHKSIAVESVGTKKTIKEEDSKCDCCGKEKSKCTCTDKDKATHAMKGLDADYEKDSRAQQHGTNPVDENKNNKSQIKETMKRLKFKKEFNGVGNALKLIPEAYKVDAKIFEMTDGNETYKIRWEGSLTEGKAVVLTAADNKMVNEDIEKMKHLFNYTSSSTLGTVKGKNRLDEDKAFTDVWNKTKTMLSEAEEGEEEEDVPVKKRKDAYDASLDVADPEDMEKSVSKADIEKSTSEPAPINKDIASDDEDDIEIPTNAELKLAKSTKTGNYVILSKMGGKIISDTPISDEMAASVKSGEMKLASALEKAKAEAEMANGDMSDDELMEEIMKMTENVKKK
jgi:hypothetical protein